MGGISRVQIALWEVSRPQESSSRKETRARRATQLEVLHLDVDFISFRFLCFSFSSRFTTMETHGMIKALICTEISNSTSSREISNLTFVCFLCILTFSSFFSFFQIRSTQTIQQKSQTTSLNRRLDFLISFPTSSIKPNSTFSIRHFFHQITPRLWSRWFRHRLGISKE